MRFKILSIRTLSVTVLAVCAIFPIFFFLFFSTSVGNYNRSVTADNAIAAVLYGGENAGFRSSTPSADRPVRLVIPKIKVNSPVEYVGLTPEGAMDVPKDPANAAWFDIGPRPGDTGNAVIAGHFGWKDGIPAVFDDLNKLERGDKIYVEDEKGTTATFVVRELRTYGENDVASEVFTSKDGKSHLNLITCEGVWSKAKKGYPNRLIVFADKE